MSDTKMRLVYVPTISSKRYFLALELTLRASTVSYYTSFRYTGGSFYEKRVADLNIASESVQIVCARARLCFRFPEEQKSDYYRKY